MKIRVKYGIHKVINSKYEVENSLDHILLYRLAGLPGRKVHHKFESMSEDSFYVHSQQFIFTQRYIREWTCALAAIL